MSTTGRLAIVAVILLAVLGVAYVAGRLFTVGAANQIRDEISAVNDARAAEKAAESGLMWENAQRIKEGMTESEVREIMGYPHGSSGSASQSLLLQWSSQDATIYAHVLLERGAVTEIKRDRR